MVRGWRSGWLCGLGLLFMCVFVAEGGGKKKKSLLVLPVQYFEGVTGEPKASVPLTRYLAERVRKSKSHRLVSPPLGFQGLVGVIKDLSRLTKLLGRSEKPEEILSVEISHVDGSYTLKGVVYHERQGHWQVFRESGLLERQGKARRLGAWLGELWLSLFPPPISLQPKAGDRKTFTAGGVGFAVRWIPAGSFVMGSPPNEPGRDSDEGPQRSVQISKGFWMLETEVTQGQYKALMGSNPSYFQGCGENCPVDWVSWQEARAFADKLSAAQGLTACTETDSGIFQCKGWRLPTEAEWEYAARAGTTTAYHTGDCVSTTEANYDGNYPQQGCAKGEYRKKTIAVCSLARNAWGLCDTHGNVWEWTMDVYGSYEGLGTQDPLRSSGGTERVNRGGSWGFNARNVRSAIRSYNAPTFRGNSLGFRLLRY